MTGGCLILFSQLILYDFQSYLNGEDVELDSDDEELFVSPHDVEERRRKRDEILKRMIPPPEMQHQHRQLRLRM